MILVPRHQSSESLEGRPHDTTRFARHAGVAAALVVLLLCVDQLAEPNVLLGIDEYDDGVYLGTAVRLVRGVIPYRDFVFVHPPGIILLLLPLSLVALATGTRVFTGAARIQTACVAAGNVLLLAQLVRHRGLFAAVVAGFALALFPLAVYADQTVLLEPYLVFFCLIGARVMFAGDEIADGRRLIWAGVAFGFAGTVKIWAIFPALAAVACCARHPRRQMRPLVAGMFAGFGVPSLPFFVLAPRTSVREVIAVQLERSGSSAAQSVDHRLAYMTGVVPSTGRAVALAGAIALGYLLVVAAGFAVRPRPRPLDWFALGTASLTVAALLRAPDFFPHYAYFTAAFLALLLAVSCDRLVRSASVWSVTWPRRRGRRRTGLSIPTVALALALLLAVVGFVRAVTRPGLLERSPDPGPAIARVVPSGACVVTDQPALALTADRFAADSGGCPSVVDSYGTWIAADPSNPPSPSGPFPSGLVDQWRSWLSRADYVVLSGDPFRIPWAPELRSWFAIHFRRILADDATVYRRVGD
jgi:hypothetical protein